MLVWLSRWENSVCGYMYVCIKFHCVYTCMYVLGLYLKNPSQMLSSSCSLCSPEVTEHLEKLSALSESGHKS